MSRFITPLLLGLAALSLQGATPPQVPSARVEKPAALAKKPSVAKKPVPKTKKASAKTSHKSKVPVTVTTVFSEGKATVTLQFKQAVSEAVIGFRGLDGLAINGAPPAPKAEFKRGETLVLEVPVTPGPGQSHLAVDIGGKFGGQRLMAVRTFATGKPSPEQEKAQAGTVVETPGGQRIKIMPVKQQ